MLEYADSIAISIQPAFLSKVWVGKFALKILCAERTSFF